MHRHYSWLYLALFFLIAVSLASFSLSYRSETPFIEPVILYPKKQVSLLFVGDIMLDRGVKKSVAENFNGSYEELFSNVAPAVAAADVAFGNLEGPISERGKNVGSKYSFRMEQTVAHVLKNVGFDVLSFANNHVGDWGMQAFTDTLDTLDNTGIAYTGAGRDNVTAATPAVQQVQGITVGFLGFSDVGPSWMEATAEKAGTLLASDPHREAYISAAAATVDFLVVSYHFGDEYAAVTNRQQFLSTTAIDAGANLVIGHHPHVVQDSMWYSGGYIAYSLGNFIFDQYFSEETLRGAMLNVTVQKQNGSVAITDVEQFTTVQDRTTYAIIDVYKETDRLNQGPCPDGDGTDMHTLVSRTVSLDSNYIPDDLVYVSPVVNTLDRDICITRETADALLQLVAAARIAGHELAVTSGYRDFYVQKELFEEHLASEQNEIEHTNVLGVAKQGHSEHQLGTTIDLTARDVNYKPVTPELGQATSGIWLADHAHEYGFVLSYPLMNTEGYKYEPWHFRYVGRTLAEHLYHQNQTLTEYLTSQL